MSEISQNLQCIDFHTHIYPQNSFRNHISETQNEKIKSAFKYYSLFTHAIQQKIHIIPDTIRKNFDPLLLAFTLPPLAANSTAADLNTELLNNNIDFAIVAAHPPVITNQHIIAETNINKKLIPCLSLNFADAELFTVSNLTNPKFILKINPMAIDFDLNDEKVIEILELWNKNSWPLVIHTGALHSSFFKHPEAGQIESLLTMVEKYKSIDFILLHMNIFKPYEALEFCQKFENTKVTTSWQSEELITIACKKLGSERILFSSDWPLVGNNIEIRKNMIQNMLQNGHLTTAEAENILYLNAQKILEAYFSKKL